MNRSFPRGLVAVALLVVSGLPAGAAAAASSTPVQLAAGYGNLPLSFEPNHGQADPTAQYLARGPGYALLLKPTGAVLQLKNSAVLRLELAGANPAARGQGREQLGGVVSYFRGANPRQWFRQIPTFGKVEYQGVYPGVDVVYYGRQRQLEFDLNLAPGANPQCITFAVTGASTDQQQSPRLAIEPDGALAVHVGADQVRFHKPQIYQEVAGNRRSIAGHYVLRGEQQFTVAVPAYDTSRPLIIDPVLGYSTFLGGTNDDVGESVAVDAGGNAYITGSTTSSDFLRRVTTGQLAGGQDVFVTKLAPSGSNVVYSVFLGGSTTDTGAAVAVDAVGCAYITGSTSSPNFPLRNALQPTLRGLQNAFVCKLDATGTNLLYSTYLGGNAKDYATAIAVDTNGSVFVSGATSSTNFPTVNPLQPVLLGAQNAFVCKLDPTGTNLVYATYLGGASNDVSTGLAIDPAGNAYVTGSTTSTNFPTVSPFQPALRGPQDAFVSKLDLTGTNLLYSTYLGGSATDYAAAIAVDASGNAYVTGATSSTNWPTANPFQATLLGSQNAFVTKLDSSGTNLVCSTYLGGSSSDAGAAIAVDPVGNILVAGDTDSPEFPVTRDAPYRTFRGGNSDGFLTKLHRSGASLVYSTFLGGTDADAVTGVALDANGNALVTGSTSSADFPVKQWAVDKIFGGTSEGFAVKIISGFGLTNDLAITKINAPKRVVLSAKRPRRTGRVRVTIQNRSQHEETIDSLATLSNLVTLSVISLGSCSNPVPVLNAKSLQTQLPVTLTPKQQFTISYDVTFDCVNNPARSSKGVSNADYRYTATVYHQVLDGQPDSHPEDDDCPRSVTPPYVIDPNPDGTIKDRGCGARKSDKTFGGDVLTDLIQKP